jgi:glc operon protein GlcG
MVSDTRVGSDGSEGEGEGAPRAAPKDAIVHLAGLDGGATCARLSAFLAVCEADPSSTGIVVAVVGADGELVAFGAHTGCPPLPRRLAPRKAITALLFRRPSEVVAREVAAETLDLAPFHDDRLLAMAGGVPVVVGERIVGAVGVSGLSGPQDAALAQRFAELLVSPSRCSDGSGDR